MNKPTLVARRGQVFLWKLYPIACLALATSACIEVAPQEVVERISIQRDGRVDIDYSGTFADLYELFSAKKGKVDAESVQKHALTILNKGGLVGEVKTLSPHTYFAHWQFSLDLKRQTYPLFRSDKKWSDEVPSLVGLERIEQLEAGFQFTDSLIGDSNDFEKNPLDKDRIGEVVTALLQQFKGTLIIEADDDLVGEHNAPIKRKIATGRSAYEWPIRFPIKNAVQFSFFFGEHDGKMLKLLRSAPGSNCLEVIGQQCKCGPFVLRMRGSNRPMANIAYEIQTSEGNRSGCTDSQGNTISVSVSTKGACEVKFLRDKSAELCPPVVGTP